MIASGSAARYSRERRVAYSPGHAYIDVGPALADARFARAWLPCRLEPVCRESTLLRCGSTKLATARRAGSGSFDWLVRRHVVIVPSSIAARLPKFAGAVFLSFVFVDPRLRAAPSGVVDYLMAHEWGHVDRGHIPCAFIALLAMMAQWLVSVEPRSTAMSALVLLSWLVIIVALFGKSVMRREREADAFAAKVVGSIPAADSLAWLVVWRGKGWSPGLRKRWKDLTVCANYSPVDLGFVMTVRWP